MINCRRVFTVVCIFVMFSAAASVQAQKPALTKSVDEPGRSPYTSTVTQQCTLGFCDFLFKPVPVGFRLVVRHASAAFQTSNANALNAAYLSQLPAIAYTAILPAMPSGSTQYVASSLVMYFVEPGSTPVLEAITTQADQSTATITGYLVSLP